jgi:hypothetical protein
MMDGFDRKGNSEARASAELALRAALGIDSEDEINSALQTVLLRAASDDISTQELADLEKVLDLKERLDAFDSLWLFGQRYFRHKFVSTDPICESCGNEVPHRTLLVCPTCKAHGPWLIREHKVQSSYVHMFLTEQVSRLVDGRLYLNGGTHFADGMVTAMPRGGAKSTWLCEITATWLILTGRARCLLLLSNTTDQVTERVNEIKTELEENERLIEDFGEQSAKRHESRTWTKDEFILPNGARVLGKGAMQSMRGVKNRQYRPDVVLADDADDDKFVTTPEQAGKVWSWWDSRVVPSCHPNAVYMINGTVIAELALLWQVMRGHRGTTFAKRIFGAIQDFPGCAKCGAPQEELGAIQCEACGQESESISPSSYWGARFSIQALETIRHRVGHWAWQTEYMQAPHDGATSWFQQEWIDAAFRRDLPPLRPDQRRVIPWQIIATTLTGEEAVKLATMVDRKYATAPGDFGPYQVIVQSWDPAWARAKPKDQMNAYMAGVSIGLTWDDKFDLFWSNRVKALPGTAAYREMLYREWIDNGVPAGGVERPGQTGMIIERNAAGVMFQYDVEEHWSSVPLIDHQTGAEKHDLIDGIPGLASSFRDRRFIVRAGGSDEMMKAMDELVYELRHSGQSMYKDMLMATWFGWAYIQRWVRDIRDPARYDELCRRRMSR